MSEAEAGIRPYDHNEVKAYQAREQCSIREAEAWHDKERFQEALQKATSFDDPREIIEFLADKVF